MTQEEIRLQVAISVIQGILEAKHGVIGEIVPSLAVAESLRIADEFVKQWFGDTEVQEVKQFVTKEVFQSISSILHEKFGLDDLDIVEFAMEIERKLQIKIPDEWLGTSGRMHTVKLK